MTRSPLCLLINGHGAVLLFFALIGLVLTVSLQHGRPLSEFYIKRVLRIWPPFALAILFSGLLELLAQGGSLGGFGSWIGYTWSKPPTASIVAQHLGLVDGRINELDNPMWSLTHEMRVSLIFPAIVLAVRARPRETCAASILLLAMVALLTRNDNSFVAQLAPC